MRIGKRWNVKRRGLLIPEISASPISVGPATPHIHLVPRPQDMYALFVLALRLSCIFNSG
jgi:hypothetical protein